jgi:hypothetical protein
VSDDERELDFAGVLAELQALVGTSVTVESAPEEAQAFHRSRGVLGRSIDLQIAGCWPLDRPARVWFCLEDSDADFVVREAGLRGAVAYEVALAEGLSRTVQMHYDGGAVLIVREELD